MVFPKLLLNTTAAVIFISCPISIGSYYLYEQLQIDKSQTAYALKIPLTYFILYHLGVIYIWVTLIWHAYLGTGDNLRNLLTNIWQNHYKVSYPIILFNEIFSFVIALYGTFDTNLQKYTATQLLYYASAFFVCNHVYSLYSRNIVRRNDVHQLPHCDKRLFQTYEYLFYIQTLIIFVCFYYSIKFDNLQKEIKPFIKFLINQLMFHVFEITKIYFVINLFVLIQFLQVIIDGIQLVRDYDQISYVIASVTVASIIIAFIYNLHILGQYYLQLRNCRDGRFFNDNPQVQITNLREEDLEKLEIKSFNSQIEVQQKRNQAVDLAQLEEQNNNTIQCPICGDDIQKKQKIILLECQHIFHTDCLIRWLKIKNSCPYCRRSAVKCQQ
ncbi:unnamed protein product [Paramecium sonneborni]|uniref:RING-type E3 ubiquitin transferase n=1 Tax=Paramecium sonneborni TaxID=65129 RepID=A0A8S1KM89_9CILI|nr:unnamed protein product [Paramecium sonneborni]